MLRMLRSLWLYRQLIVSSIQSEFKARFARSKLGGLWGIINPLAQVAIYGLILSNVLAAKLPNIDNKYAYAIYLMAGLLGWNLFNDIINRSLNIFIVHGNLMKKMNFPRIALPVIVMGSAIIDNLLLLVSMLGIFLILGQPFTWAMLWLFPLMLLVVFLATSMGLILGTMNVFVRDLSQIVPIVLQIWFWFTPVVYPESIIPQAYRHLLNLNPMYPIISAYHQILVYGELPSVTIIGLIALMVLGLVLFSLFVFRRANAELVDAL